MTCPSWDVGKPQTLSEAEFQNSRDLSARRQARTLSADSHVRQHIVTNPPAGSPGGLGDIVGSAVAADSFEIRRNRLAVLPYCSSFRTWFGSWLAWAMIAVAACDRTCARESCAVAVA
jgi:hypothetical protein